MEWPPDYFEAYRRRAKEIVDLRRSPDLIPGAKQYYSTRYLEFIEHWFYTYDPRNSATGLPVKMPFLLFERQKEFLQFLQELVAHEVNGLVEKSRDMGATWLCCAFSVCEWLFQPGVAIGWGSRKEQLVDKLGDPDSIFEKMRIILRHLPSFFLPQGFDIQKHATHMRIINPETGATITGEAGDNIGRGGRNKAYFKDESAWYERPELIEAALADNTNIQVDISSVHGPNNIFARRRQSGVDWYPGDEMQPGQVHVFVMDWRDHPLKDQEWYDRRRAKADREGLLHVFKQEVDRDYAASVEGVLIPREWIDAAIDAHKRLGFDGEGQTIAALDVADEGGDRNALSIRTGSILRSVDIWGQGDVGQTAQRAISAARLAGCQHLFYDSIGVGAGVKAEANRMVRDGVLDGKSLEITGWNAAAKPMYAKARIIRGDRSLPTNREFFKNLKAQGWWNLRKRFENTFNLLHNGAECSTDELISISSGLKHVHELVTELSQIQYSPNSNGQIMIDKTPPGTKSPNAADSVMMNYWPVFRVKTRVGM